MISSLLLMAVTLVPADFPEPAGLEPNVGFWQRVYSEWTSANVAFHDREHMGVVYRVVDLEDLRLHPRPADPGVRSLRAAARREILQEVEAEILAGLRSLSDLAAAGRLVPEELDEPLGELYRAFEEAGASSAIAGSPGRLRRQFGLADRFYEGLHRYDRYRNFVAEAFARRGLPEDLLALAFVESLFDPTAVSHAGAVGMFQFMPATGREYGLTRGQFWDFRLDPLLAAEAAARMLRRNYERLGNWPLALTGYNHGPNGVARGVAQVGSSDLMELIDRFQSPSWGFASKNFYAQFLAARRTLAARYEIFGDWVGSAPLDMAEVGLGSAVRPLTLVRRGCVNQETLTAYNPALRPAAFTGNGLLPRGFKLRVPSQSVEEVLACATGSSAVDRARRIASAGDYRVVAGDTLSHIARRHGVTVDDLIEMNGLCADGAIHVGQVIRVPSRGTLD